MVAAAPAIPECPGGWSDAHREVFLAMPVYDAGYLSVSESIRLVCGPPSGARTIPRGPTEP